LRDKLIRWRKFCKTTLVDKQKAPPSADSENDPSSPSVDQKPEMQGIDHQVNDIVSPAKPKKNVQFEKSDEFEDEMTVPAVKKAKIN
jgi:hypothetical protein